MRLRCARPVSLVVLLELASFPLLSISTEALTFGIPGPHVVPQTSSEWLKWIEVVRQRALDYTDELPDFICTQTTRRYAALEGDSRWQSRDFWEAELSYSQKNERYSRVRLNGKASSSSVESLGGALSIGEFGSILRTLFLPETRTQFWKESEEEVLGISTVVAGFRVDQEHSRWTLSFRNSHSLNVEYQGKMWVDSTTHQILRISQHTLQLPPNFPITYAEMTTEYDYLRVAGLAARQYLLPKGADLILQERQPPMRSRNVIEFRDYRKFTADVRLVPD
jgi:hypothetical protein